MKRDVIKAKPVGIKKKLLSESDNLRREKEYRSSIERGDKGAPQRSPELSEEYK